MSDQAPYSRRSFLSGVIATGTLAAVATYAAPGGRLQSRVELRLSTGGDPTGARDLLVSMWNETNPQTIVRVDPIDSGSGDERRIMLEKAAAGEADLLNLDIVDVPEFATKGLIEKIPPTGGRQLITPLEQVSRVPDEPGAYWAAPFNTDVGMLFTRLDGDSTEAPPRRLPDLLATIPDGSQQFVGQLRPNVSAFYEAFVVNVLEHAVAERPAVLKPLGTPGVERPADRISTDLELWKAALQPLKDAIDAGKVLTSGGEPESLEAFGAADSTIRYLRSWPVEYRKLQLAGNRDVATGRIRVDPLSQGILGGQSLAVVADSRYVDRALAFISFATSEGAQKILASHGIAPTAIGAYNDPNLRASIPHLVRVREAVENSLPRPVHPGYRRFSDVVKEHVERFLYEDQDLSPQFTTEMASALA